MKQGKHTVRPGSLYTAHGAQPAEAELTDEDIRKFDLFTEEEIEKFLPWEMEKIRKTPYKKLKAIMDSIRSKQCGITDAGEK